MSAVTNANAESVISGAAFRSHAAETAPSQGPTPGTVVDAVVRCARTLLAAGVPSDLSGCLSIRRDVYRRPSSTARSRRFNGRSLALPAAVAVLR